MLFVVGESFWLTHQVLHGKMQCMESATNPLPTTRKELQWLVQSQHKELQIKQAKLDQQSQFIDQLLEQIRLSRHQHFGARSERFNIDQVDWLFNEAEVLSDGASNSATPTDSESINAVDDIEQGIPIAAHVRKAGGRRPLPPELPRVEVIHDIDDEDKVCAHDDSPLKPIGEKVSEQLDIVPAKVRVIRHIRRQYACSKCDNTIKTAPLPPQPIAKSIATPGTIAHVAVSKYADGLPLYRQSKQWERQAIYLPRTTLANWMIKAGILIQPLINLMRDKMLDYDIIGMDETRVQVLKEVGKSPQSQSYLWVQRGGPPDNPIILFDYDPSRSQEVPKRLLSSYTGYLQTDAYEGYNKVCAENGITQLGCWAHVRRKFDEALKAQGKNATKRKSSLAAIALKRIQLLYRIERKAKDLESEQRYPLRQSRAVPVLADFRQWLDQHLPLVPAKSALGKAMHYTHKQWDKLTIYTQDGRLNIDNNKTENAIRPFVVGRKNWLFCDTVAGANASANLYSLVETAKANNQEPYTYLKTIFTELPKATSIEDIETLLPFEPITELEQAA